MMTGLLLALGGCTSVPESVQTGASSQAHATPMAPSGLLDAVVGARYILLGEVHDNSDGHAIRLEWLRLLARDRRFVIAMEQFDRPRQADIDAARQRIEASRGAVPLDDTRLREQALELARAGGFASGAWDWPSYEPVVMLALRNGLPLQAANLPASEAMALARGQPRGPAGLAAPSLEPTGAWNRASQEAIEVAIRDGHCGLLPERAVAPMVRAQLARDRAMAEVMIDAARRTGLPVVLLAGNGHVRTDIGVPRHLAALDPGARQVSVGVIERDERPEGRYDRFARVDEARRADPCESLRKHFGAPAR